MVRTLFRIQHPLEEFKDAYFDLASKAALFSFHKRIYLLFAPSVAAVSLMFPYNLIRCPLYIVLRSLGGSQIIS